jgi:glycosyltransferase involved in cell wall biosynthesis
VGRIKVLHIIGGGEFGGAEQHLLTLIKHLNISEFEVHIACLFSEPLASLVKNEGFPVHIFTMNSKLDLKPITQLASLIKREGFHIVHTHGVRANLIGRLAAKKAGTGIVVTTVHSVLAFDYKHWLDRWLNRLSEKLTGGITVRYITVCEVLAGHLIREGIPVDRIVTIHNGLEINKYNPDNTDGLKVRQEYGIAENAKVIGIVARLHHVKGHLFLLQALARTVKDFPSLVLLIVGTGPDKPELETMTQKLGLEGNVIFTGFRKDIPDVISVLDFLVLPSLSEGLSLTIMEGMAMQKPVLATAVGGTPEIITSGIDGLLVASADTNALAEGMCHLLRDQKKVREMGLAARKIVEARFSAELMAEKTAAVYRDLCK